MCTLIQLQLLTSHPQFLMIINSGSIKYQKVGRIGNQRKVLEQKVRIEKKLNTIRSDGATEGSTELYTASFGNTRFTNCFWELLYKAVKNFQHRHQFQTIKTINIKTKQIASKKNLVICGCEFMHTPQQLGI